MNQVDKQLLTVGGMVGAIVLAFGVAMMSTDPSEEPTVGDGALSRDAAYQGSLTLAGMAIFGSALASRIKSSTERDPSDRHLGIILATLAPLALAGMHLMFAGYLCCNDPAPLLRHLAMLSGGLVAMSVAGYVALVTNPRNPR